MPAIHGVRVATVRRMRTTAAPTWGGPVSGSAGTQARMSGTVIAVITAMMIHQVFHLTLVSSSVEASTARNVAMPWKPAHQPIAMFAEAGCATRRMRAGATTPAIRKPTPSSMRVSIRNQVCVAKAPAREPTASRTMPTTRVRRSPQISENREAASPSSMEPTCTMPSSTPESTRDRPRSARMKSRAPGSFQMCMAEATPAPTTMIQARDPPEAVARCGDEGGMSTPWWDTTRQWRAHRPVNGLRGGSRGCRLSADLDQWSPHPPGLIPSDLFRRTVSWGSFRVVSAQSAQVVDLWTDFRSRV